MYTYYRAVVFALAQKFKKNSKKFLLLLWISFPTYTLGTKAASPLVKVDQRSHQRDTINLSTSADISRYEVERLPTRPSAQSGW